LVHILVVNIQVEFEELEITNWVMMLQLSLKAPLHSIICDNDRLPQRVECALKLAIDKNEKTRDLKRRQKPHLNRRVIPNEKVYEIFLLSSIIHT